MRELLQFEEEEHEKDDVTMFRQVCKTNEVMGVSYSFLLWKKVQIQCHW